MRREISNLSFISEGWGGSLPLPAGTEHQLLCSHGVCSEPEMPMLEWAHQLSLLRQNSLVQRKAWEARAASTIPSTIPTD